jgi:hypothetical protein
MTHVIYYTNLISSSIREVTNFVHLKLYIALITYKSVPNSFAIPYLKFTGECQQSYEDTPNIGVKVFMCVTSDIFKPIMDFHSPSAYFKTYIKISEMLKLFTLTDLHNILRKKNLD